MGGAGIAAIVRDEKLSKMGALRNFPRNLKVKPSAIDKLGVQRPPLVEDLSSFQVRGFVFHPHGVPIKMVAPRFALRHGAR